MFDLALNAGLPIVACTTKDTLNLLEVLQTLSTRPVHWYSQGLKANAILVKVGGSEPFTPEDYQKFLNLQATVLLVNHEEVPEVAFFAGEVPVPKELMAFYLEKVVDDVPTFLRLSAGLTIKEMSEVLKLSQHRDGSVSPEGFRAVRARVVGSLSGLIEVPDSPYAYMPPKPLVRWMEENQPYFFNSPDPRLTPRGLLFYGMPGTGKTAGAKYLSKRWGIPLYRLDMASALGKYVGESEANMRRVLDTVDREEPCILLLDEVEKLFADKDDSGVTPRLLAQLLWWLQEHDSRVLTVMTTNDKDVLPEELYRVGRIDERIEMEPLSPLAGDVFTKFLIQQYMNPTNEQLSLIKERVSEFYKLAGGKLTHAQILSTVQSAIKQHKMLLPE